MLRVISAICLPANSVLYFVDSALIKVAGRRLQPIVLGHSCRQNFVRKSFLFSFGIAKIQMDKSQILSVTRFPLNFILFLFVEIEN